MYQSSRGASELQCSEPLAAGTRLVVTMGWRQSALTLWALETHGRLTVPTQGTLVEFDRGLTVGQRRQWKLPEEGPVRAVSFRKTSYPAHLRDGFRFLDDLAAEFHPIPDFEPGSLCTVLMVPPPKSLDTQTVEPRPRPAIRLVHSR